MSLMRTLGKVAMGVIVAKGVGKMMGGGRGGNSAGSGLGGLLGGLLGGKQAGGSSSGGQGGGIGDLLGGLSGKSGGGGLGGILDSLNGGGSQSGGTSGGGIGGMLNDAIQGNNVSANNEEEAQAELLLKAMLNAAKSDGVIDDEEKRKITEHLGDVSDEEADFVRRELESPLDTQGLINDVPRGMEQQVYFISLLAIDLDSNKEAHYLDELAKGLNISNEICNQIHEKVGAPALYS